VKGNDERRVRAGGVSSLTVPVVADASPCVTRKCEGHAQERTVGLTTSSVADADPWSPGGVVGHRVTSAVIGTAWIVWVLPLFTVPREKVIASIGGYCDARGHRYRTAGRDEEIDDDRQVAGRCAGEGRGGRRADRPIRSPLSGTG